MNIDLNKLNEAFHLFLNEFSPSKIINPSYSYSVFPTGKLFRPQLVWSTSIDFNKKLTQGDVRSAQNYFSAAVEFHHVYTLIHDDLPCMDDDNLRRGKNSCHIEFNEWIALLTGDGLLNLSYHLLSRINSPYLSDIIRFFSWALGPKGLIFGQYLDLSWNDKCDFETLLRVHELKTARLIQVSLIGSYLISKKDIEKKELKYLFKLGSYIGISFQLLDDLSELGPEELTAHEIQINPWPKNFSKCFDALEKRLLKSQVIIKKLELNSLSKVLENYFLKMEEIILDKKSLPLYEKYFKKSELNSIQKLFNANFWKI